MPARSVPDPDRDREGARRSGVSSRADAAAERPSRSRGARTTLRRALLLLALLAATAALAALRPGSGPLSLAATALRDGGGAAWGTGTSERAIDLEAPGPLTLAWMRLRGPPTVGVQVGHLDAEDHPEELAALRTSTGGHAAGVDEVDLNRAIAEALAARLRARGVRVDLLPATLPPRYRADVLLSLHADASLDPRRRGYKSTHAREPRNPLEPRLDAAVDAAYLAAAPLPDDHANVSGAMLDYYAFDARRYRHAAHRATPAVIVEMGYLSHPDDRRWLLSVDGPADALADGVTRYLGSVGRWHPAAAPDGARSASAGSP